MPRSDAEPRPRRACCLVSEILEEAGLDRSRAREIRRQILEGVILLCRWQLERLGRAAGGTERPSAKRARRLRVE
jgi:hypothetical protein